MASPVTLTIMIPQEPREIPEQETPLSYDERLEGLTWAQAVQKFSSQPPSQETIFQMDP